MDLTHLGGTSILISSSLGDESKKAERNRLKQKPKENKLNQKREYKMSIEERMKARQNQNVAVEMSDEEALAIVSGEKGKESFVIESTATTVAVPAAEEDNILESTALVVSHPTSVISDYEEERLTDAERAQFDVGDPSFGVFPGIKLENAKFQVTRFGNTVILGDEFSASVTKVERYVCVSVEGTDKMKADFTRDHADGPASVNFSSPISNGEDGKGWAAMHPLEEYVSNMTGEKMSDIKSTILTSNIAGIEARTTQYLRVTAIVNTITGATDPALVESIVGQIVQIQVSQAAGNTFQAAFNQCKDMLGYAPINLQAVSHGPY
jgi:hypothetical protein